MVDEVDARPLPHRERVVPRPPKHNLRHRQLRCVRRLDNECRGIITQKPRVDSQVDGSVGVHVGGCTSPRCTNKHRPGSARRHDRVHHNGLHSETRRDSERDTSKKVSGCARNREEAVPILACHSEAHAHAGSKQPQDILHTYLDAMYGDGRAARAGEFEKRSSPVGRRKTRQGRGWRASSAWPTTAEGRARHNLVGVAVPDVHLMRHTDST